SLAEDRRFNLIAYSSEVRPWGKTLEQATPGAKKKAVRFIDGLKAQGVTFTDLALAEAIADPRVDTIYLITDGAPTHVGSRGRDLPEDASRLMKRILLETRSVNYLRGIRIFTLGFEGAEEAFLKRLAAEHEGIYVRIE
ncbi:MAG: VWA domain-containing protein, partial [Planctomycetota bacterium]